MQFSHFFPSTSLSTPPPTETDDEIPGGKGNALSSSTPATEGASSSPSPSSKQSKKATTGEEDKTRCFYREYFGMVGIHMDEGFKKNDPSTPEYVHDLLKPLQCVSVQLAAQVPPLSIYV
jgi:hypothetical protein